MASEDGGGGRHYRGLLVDWGGVMTSNLFTSFSAFCEGQGSNPTRSAGASARTQTPGELLIGLETGAVQEAEFEPRFAAMLGVNPTGLIDRLFAGSSLDQEMVDAVGGGQAGRDQHRADLQLVGHAPLRPQAARRAVRRDRDLRRGGDAQARPAHVRAGRRAGSASSRSRACSSTTCRSTSPRPRISGWRTIHHVSAEATIPQLERLLDVPLTRAARTRRDRGVTEQGPATRPTPSP